MVICSKSIVLSFSICGYTQLRQTERKSYGKKIQKRSN